MQIVKPSCALSQMAFRSLRFPILLARFCKTRCYPSKLAYIPSFPSFALHALSNSLDKEISNHNKLDERFILEELYNLLPISRNNLSTACFKSQKTMLEDSDSGQETKSVDGFLLPEEKLRGVFLQRLKGKAAVECALSSVGVDVTVEILERVVNSWNLGGEAMNMFFNWATKQPMVPKDIDSYCIIVKALGRRKFFKYMMEVLYKMREEGIEPDLRLLSIVFDSYVRAGQVSKAIQLFGNMDDIGLKRNTESLNVLLLCLCQRSLVSAANSVFHKMEGKIPFSITTYNIMIGGWSKFGKVSEIERTMEAMVGNGCRPDCRTFNYLIEGLGRAGRLDDAVDIFHNMKQENFPSDTGTYNAMIFNYISVGDFDECMKYYNKILSNNCEPNVDTYTRIITAFLKVRKVADALQMFDEMLARGVFPSTGTITSFIKYLCSYGPPYAVLILYKKFRKLGIRISMDAYKILLKRLWKLGKCGTMLCIWEEMQECGYSSDMEVYQYIISGLCNIGHLENAVLVMEECLQQGFCPSRLVYSKLSNRLLASNKTERAYKLFLKITNARSRENARRYWRANGWHF